MNNKGQTLVIFVILLPIILIIFTLVIDLGFLYIEKRNINNNVYSAMEYYLDNITDIDIYDKTNKLLNKNIDDVEQININENDEYVEIKVVKIKKGIYSIITNNTNIEVKYKGFKENKEIKKG